MQENSDPDAGKALEAGDFCVTKQYSFLLNSQDHGLNKRTEQLKLFAELQVSRRKRQHLTCFPVCPRAYEFSIKHKAL